MAGVPLYTGMSSQASSPPHQDVPNHRLQLPTGLTDSSSVLKGSSTRTTPSPSSGARAASAAATAPTRTVIIGGHARDVSSMQPAFIETDFTVPLVNAPGQGRQVAHHHQLQQQQQQLQLQQQQQQRHHHYQRDVKTFSSQSSSARQSPLSVISPSVASASSLQLLSPGAVIPRGPSPSNIASSLSNHSKLLAIPHRTLSRSAGNVSGNELVQNVQRSASTSMARARTTPSDGRIANREVGQSVRDNVSASRHLGRQGEARAVNVDPPSRPIGDVIPRTIPVSAHQAPYARDRFSSSADLFDELASSHRSTSQHHLQAAHQRHDGDTQSTFDGRRQADRVAQQRSAADFQRVQISNSRQFQILDRPSNGSRLVPANDLSSSVPFSSMCAMSSMSGYRVVQQPKRQSYQSPNKIHMAESVLRPALMRMAAFNPEVSVAFKSSTGSSRRASNPPVISDWTMGGGRFTSARSNVTQVSDVTSLYRNIQPKPTGTASSEVEPRIVPSSRTFRPPSILSPANSSLMAVSSSFSSDRTPMSLGSRQFHSASMMISPQRFTSGPLAKSPSSAPLGVPRVPAAAHILSKTKQPPQSPLPPPPPYVHRAPLVSPPVTFHRSAAVKTETVLPSSLSMSSMLGRSAYQVVTSLPRYSADSIDPLPLDCSRKNNVSVVDNSADSNYVLNLTTSGSAPMADTQQSEVIDLSGGGSSSSHAVNRVQTSVSCDKGELTDLSVVKKLFGFGDKVGQVAQRIEPVSCDLSGKRTTAVNCDEVKLGSMQDECISGGLAAALGINERSRQRKTVRDVEMKNGSTIRDISNVVDTFDKQVDSPAALVAMEPIVYEEREFVWDDYLEETKSSAAPATSFKHVEFSLQSGFIKGMLVEVANRSPAGTYWVASIIVPCGELLQLRPLSCLHGASNDASHDFWCNVGSADMHPLGWCRDHQRTLCPPEELAGKLENWQSLLAQSLEGATTPPSYMLDPQTGTLPIDQIKEGMYLEAQLDLDPNIVWLVKVIENIGGRLLLRYDGSDLACSDFWLFYLHHRLHPIGWARLHGCTYQLPESVKQAIHLENFNSESYIEESLKKAEAQQPPCEIFQDQAVIKEHRFIKGWKLEALHPSLPSVIRPATVTHVFNDRYFLVELDDLTENVTDRHQVCCHSRSLNIFPIGWCSANGMKLTPVPGHEKCDFEWSEYLKDCKAEAAPADVFCDVPEDYEFEAGMKLESVNPSQHGQIAVGTIKDVIDGRLLRLVLDHLSSLSMDDKTFLYPIDSFDVFPIGWAESGDYQLKTPVMRTRVAPAKPVAATVSRNTAVNHAEHLVADERTALYRQLKEADGRSSGSWCPKIYFNYRCFTGPYLSKGRLVLLPQFVGPGPVVLVMKEVLSMLINVAYKPSRVLRELQLDGTASSNMHQQVLQAKYNGKSYSAKVEICKTGDEVDEFCRQVCRRLECCLNLVSPHCITVAATCPDNCSRLSKTKFTNYFGKKRRKIGRPAGGHSNIDSDVKKTGKRRRNRKNALTIRKKHTVSRPTQDGATNEQDGVKYFYNAQSSDDGDCWSQTTFKSTTHVNGTTGGQIRIKIHRKRKTLDDESAVPSKKLAYCSHSSRDNADERRKKKNNKRILSALTVETNGFDSCEASPCQVFNNEAQLKLTSNPLHWSVRQVADFLLTTDCASMAKLMVEQEIDGQSMMMLSLPTIQEYLEMKLGPAIKLCHQIERVKVAFFEQFA